MIKFLRTKWILGALFALLALGVVGTAQANPLQFYFNESQSVWDLSPWWVTTGDVMIYEDQSLAVLSDALRFVSVLHGDSQSGYYYTTEVHFYSQLGGTEPADTGFPPDLGLEPNTLRIFESDLGTFTFSPSSVQPGGAIGMEIIYYGISDAVPDGGFTVAFLGLALVGLLGMRRSTAV